MKARRNNNDDDAIENKRLPPGGGCNGNKESLQEMPRKPSEGTISILTPCHSFESSSLPSLACSFFRGLVVVDKYAHISFTP